MNVSDIPGSARLAENHPYLYNLEIKEAAGLVLGKLCHGGWSSPWHAQKQQQLQGQLHESLATIDWSSPDTTLVQIGANDGEYNDPIQAVLETSNIRAILVEPVDVAFDALRKRHEGKSRITPVQAAISRNGDDISLFVPHVETRVLHSTVWTSSDQSLVREQVRRNLGRKCSASMVLREVVTPTLTAAELLASNGVRPSEVAAVVCDTEGQDAELVRSFFDAGATPRVIYYEQLHIEPQQRVSLKNELQAQGYHLAETKKDVLAIAA